MTMLLIELFVVVALSNLNLACFWSFQSNFVNFMNLGTEKIKPKATIKQAFRLFGVMDSFRNMKKNCASFPKSSACKHVCTRFAHTLREFMYFVVSLCPSLLRILAFIYIWRVFTWVYFQLCVTYSLPN